MDFFPMSDLVIMNSLLTGKAKRKISWNFLMPDFMKSLVMKK